MVSCKRSTRIDINPTSSTAGESQKLERTDQFHGVTAFHPMQFQSMQFQPMQF